MFKATPSCTSVSGPEFLKGSCRRALYYQHNSHHTSQSDSLGMLISVIKIICVSLHTCSIRTTEDAKKVEIAKACGLWTRNRSMNSYSSPSRFSAFNIDKLGKLLGRIKATKY